MSNCTCWDPECYEHGKEEGNDTTPSEERDALRQGLRDIVDAGLSYEMLVFKLVALLESTEEPQSISDRAAYEAAVLKAVEAVADTAYARKVNKILTEQADTITAQQAQVSALRAYAAHLPTCDYMVHMYACTCGLTALLTEEP